MEIINVAGRVCCETNKTDPWKIYLCAWFLVLLVYIRGESIAGLFEAMFEGCSGKPNLQSKLTINFQLLRVQWFRRVHFGSRFSVSTDFQRWTHA